MMWQAITLGGALGKVRTGPDELELCRRITAGERHLFGGIVARYQGLVAGAITAQGVPTCEVEDLAQQVFINAYKGLSGFRGEAKLSSWLYRIAINVARQSKRRALARPSQESVEEALEAGRQPVDAAPPTGEAVVRSEALAKALAQLSAPQRAALVLYYFEEQSYEEIAEALELNLNTVRTHIRRGKQRLAGLLDEATLAGA
jgi:RNA polymerase sigma-70 factor, ECF subfamily